MSESLSGIISQVQTIGIVMAAVIVVLYVLTIIWVVRDAPLRGVSVVKWGIISLIPFLGALIYSALRPPMLLSDREEQEMDYLLRQRELMKYGECGRCGYPVQDDFVMCPSCGSQLKNVCSHCERPLNPEWSVCPFCCTKVRNRSKARAASHAADATAVAYNSDHSAE